MRFFEDGAVAEHPAETYDQAVGGAIRRLFPGADLKQTSERSREVPDFVFRYKNQEILVETKWRFDPVSHFRGARFQCCLIVCGMTLGF